LGHEEYGTAYTRDREREFGLRAGESGDKDLGSRNRLPEARVLCGNRVAVAFDNRDHIETEGV